MRTTVDLPPELHNRVKQLASATHRSLSITVAELAARGLASMSEPARLTTDSISGLPVIDGGRLLTSAEVAELIDED